jgi:hypothetical protein
VTTLAEPKPGKGEEPGKGEGEEGASAPPGLRPVARALGVIVAPTSLVSALLYWYGWSHSTQFYGYFGIDASALGFGTRDYLIRSLDGLFVPMTVIACAGLAALWGHSLLRSRLAAGAWPAVLRVLVPALAAAGLVLVVGGLWSTVASTFLRAYVAAAPLSLASGVALLVYTLRLRRLAGRAPVPGGLIPVLEWAVVFVIIGLSLFWAATDYAVAVARSRAWQTVRDLPTFPPVVLYSARSLSLHVPGVTETRCHDAQAAYRVRYDGLRLLPASGDQYVLLPAHWNPATGVAVILPRTESVRLEYAVTIPRMAPGC